MQKIESCGKRIEKALFIRKMNRSELCELAGVPKSSLSLYLREAYEPKQDKIYKMANALNVNEFWLMGYNVPMERDSTPPITDRELTDNEKTMLELFRSIPDSQQKVLIRMMRGGLDIR